MNILLPDKVIKLACLIALWAIISVLGNTFDGIRGVFDRIEIRLKDSPSSGRVLYEDLGEIVNQDSTKGAV